MIPLEQSVLVSRYGRRRRLGDCTLHNLAIAHRLAVQDGRRMVLRNSPARLYMQRVLEAAIFFSLGQELQAERVAKVRRLPEEAQGRAIARAELMGQEVAG